MQGKMIGMCIAVLVAGCCAPESKRSQATPYSVPAAWQLKTFCGKDFWPLFTPGFWSCDTPEWKAEGARCHQSWPPPECYAGSALIHDATKQIMNDRPRRYGDVPRTDYPKPLKVSDFFYSEARKSFEGNPKPDKPCLLEIQNARPVFRLREKYDLDVAGFAAWKSAHPNFVGLRAMTEFDSDSMNYETFMRKSTNEALKAELTATFGTLSNRYERLEFLRRAVKRSEALRFGEKDFWTMFSSCVSMGHQMADAGAKGLFYEATSQECARWQIGGAFLRGASRQFGIPFGWYVANWCTGYTRDGKLYTGANSMPVMQDANHRPFGGAGRTSFDRLCAYGYLIGASFLEPEYPIRIHYDQPTKDAPRVPSDFAKDFNDLYLLSERLDRGIVYSPCAMLVPLSVKYTAHGSAWYGEHPFALNAFFYTLAPIYSEDQFQRDLRKRGLQSCLFNSEFGEFYDVLAPDSRQAAADFEAALGAYKWAFLLEEYRPGELNVPALAAFVERGGTLVVSADQARLLPPSLVGIAFGTERAESGSALVVGNRRVDLGEAYDWWLPTGSPEAKPWIADEKGGTAVYANRYGHGRVLTVASKMMLPRAFEEAKQGMDSYALLHEVTSGRRTFALIRQLLLRAQEETMPVTVSGDVQWGVNFVEGGRTGGRWKIGEQVGGGRLEVEQRRDNNSTVQPSTSHWLVWLINNKGVKKYSFEPEEFDASAVADVCITFRPTGEVRKVRVEPGKWTTVEIGVE